MKKFLGFLATLLLTACSLVEPSSEIELIPYAQKDKYGYFDLEGKIVINPQFGFATAFREDLALVKTTGEEAKWGYIGKDGKYVINATYKDATVFQEGLAWVVTENSAPMAIDTKGKTKFTLKDAEEVILFSEGLAAFSKSDSISKLWGFVDREGKQVINPQFYEVNSFASGRCAVKNKEGKWGYIDNSGKIIINYQFDAAADFIDDQAVVYLDEKAGVINSEGKYIVNPQFQYAEIDGDNYCVWQDEKGGWCDKDAKFIINPQFESVNNFGDSNLAAVKSSDKYGYIDREGKIIINPQFEGAWPFMNEVALVKSGEKFGLINEEGKYVANPQFDEIGFDMLVYLSTKKGSIKNSVSSQFVDINTILNVVKLANPEGLSFKDSFKKIAGKYGKKASDFSTTGTNILFDKKAINKDAQYGFGVLGDAVTFDYYSYDKSFTASKPYGFVYGIQLLGKATGRAEALIKAFEIKLKKLALVKKGYIDDTYTSVYKSGSGYIICSNDNSDTVVFYILSKDFEVDNYLNKIGTKPETIVEEDYSEETYTEAVDSAAYDEY